MDRAAAVSAVMDDEDLGKSQHDQHNKQKQEKHWRNVPPLEHSLADPSIKIHLTQLASSEPAAKRFPSDPPSVMLHRVSVSESHNCSGVKAHTAFRKGEINFEGWD